MYILDTNVVSELRKAAKANPGVLAWAGGVATESLYLSAVTILELEIGILQRERLDPAQGAVLRRWMTQAVLPAFSGRVLAFDCEAARRCARLHVPTSRHDRDTMIAAIALVHAMTVVTRNTSDFTLTGVPLINPWVDIP